MSKTTNLFPPQTILVVLEKLDKERMGAVIGQMLMLDSKDSVTARKHMEKTIRHPIASHFVERVLQVDCLAYM